MQEFYESDNGMSVQVRFQEDRLGLRITGELDPAALLDVLHAVSIDPRFKDTLNWLWDMREASVAKSTPDDVRSVASFARSLVSTTTPTRVAFVAGTQLGFGLARMTSSYAETELRVAQAFHTLPEAEAWLEQGSK